MQRPQGDADDPRVWEDTWGFWKQNAIPAHFSSHAGGIRRRRQPLGPW
jgi:hypothetical protein